MTTCQATRKGKEFCEMLSENSENKAEYNFTLTLEEFKELRKQGYSIARRTTIKRKQDVMLKNFDILRVNNFGSNTKEL